MKSPLPSISMFWEPALWCNPYLRRWNDLPSKQLSQANGVEEPPSSRHNRKLSSHHWFLVFSNKKEDISAEKCSILVQDCVANERSHCFREGDDNRWTTLRDYHRQGASTLGMQRNHSLKEVPSGLIGFECLLNRSSLLPKLYSLLECKIEACEMSVALD